MRPLVVIQARTASTRLPGKISMLIGHRSMLSCVYDRVASVGKTLIARAENYPAIPEEDVLRRFAVAVRMLECTMGQRHDPIVRVTADCPLIDPGVIHRMLDHYGRSTLECLQTGPEWDGLDVGIVSRQALIHADQRATEPYDREHVTPWMLRHVKSEVVTMEGPALRWSVDDLDGLQFVRRVYELCEYCQQGVPRHTNAASSIGGLDRHVVWDLHHLERGDLAECAAYDVLKTRMGRAVYVSQ